jgi:hypothetical protein
MTAVLVWILARIDRAIYRRRMRRAQLQTRLGLLRALLKKG